MIVTGPKWLLTKMRLRPCNDNRNLDGGDASIQLMDEVGFSWQIRQASLLAIVNEPTEIRA